MHIHERPAVDIEDGLARIRGNKRLYKRMLGLFVNSAEFETLEQAIASGDWQKAGDIAHTIKGMSGNLSLTAVFELSASLMTELRQGGPPGGQTLEQYRAALQNTIDKIDEIIPTLD